MSMKVIIRALAVLAVVQLGLTVYTHLDNAPLATSSSRGVLLSFDKDKVDSLTIKGAAKEEQVVLSQRDGKWQLASGFPADQDKVNALLGKLTDLKHGLPVATSTAALKRFKVAEDEFERSVTLQQGNSTLASLYLGTGNGARQNNARNANDTAIYSIELGSYDLPATVDEWEDKTVLNLDKQGLTSVTLGGLKLVPETADKQTGDAARIWKMAALPAGKLLNQQAINENLNALLTLRYRTVLGKESKPEYGLDKPPLLTVSVAHPGGEREYHFGQLKDKDDFVLKVSDREEYFQIPNHAGKPLVEGMVVDKWLMDEPKAAESSAPVVPVPAAQASPVPVAPVPASPETAPAAQEPPVPVAPAPASPETTPTVPTAPAQ